MSSSEDERHSEDIRRTHELADGELSDLAFAYRLQLDEAIAASLSALPSSSSSSLPSSSSKPSRIASSNVGDLIDFAGKEVERCEQERKDRKLCEIEARKYREDLSRRIHDRNVALEILRMDDEDWDEFGDDFERPFGEGSSSSSLSNVNFRLYFKGLVSVERVGDSDITLAGIGVAICDPKDNLIFEMSKPLLGNGMNRRVTEIKALIEGLETALALDLKRITFFCDYPTIYQYARQVWTPTGRKVSMLMDKVMLLREGFAYCRPALVARFDMKFAFKLARDAIASQKSEPAQSNHTRIIKETCVICLEETDQDKMFNIDDCMHKYCFSCMRQHVEAKLYCGMIPKCPHESCKFELNVISCEKFLTPNLVGILKERIKEASIPVDQKVYCAYPKCSALMSKSEISDFTKNEKVHGRWQGARKCMKCYGVFCMYCKVPWHKNMICREYKRSNPPDDSKLKSLATRNLWRQCVKCNHMIELAEGCYHMTCRCGYQFCYTCGAEWKDKKATCSCPLWDEDNILYDTDSDEDYDDDYDEEDYDYTDEEDYTDEDVTTVL